MRTQRNQSLLIEQGEKESFESKSQQIVKDYRHGNRINLIIFMNICAAWERQPRSFACVGKSDKRTDALWYPGHLMWSKLPNTKAGGFEQPRATQKLKHSKRKVCI